MLNTYITFLVFILGQSQSLKPHRYLSKMLLWLHMPTLSISLDVSVFSADQQIPCLQVFHYSCVLPPQRVWNTLSLSVIGLLEKQQFRPKSWCPCFHSVFMPIQQQLFEYTFISSRKDFPLCFSCAKVAVSEEPMTSSWKTGRKAPLLGKSNTRLHAGVDTKQQLLTVIQERYPHIPV